MFSVPNARERRALRKRLGGAGVLVLGGAIIAATASGVSFAVAAGGHGGYLACANSKGTLALRSNAKCPRGYHSVHIGARGATGKRGPAQLARIYRADRTGNEAELVGGTQTAVETLVLPAGSYEFTYSVGLNDKNTNDNVECWVQNGNEGLMSDFLVPFYSVAIAKGGLGLNSGVGAGTLMTKRHAILYCANEAVSGDVSVVSSQLVAVPGTLDNQPN